MLSSTDIKQWIASVFIKIATWSVNKAEILDEELDCLEVYKAFGKLCSKILDKQALNAYLFKAMELAFNAHDGQVDKAGQPYTEHLEYVASKMTTKEEKIVAWLHDILEDTEVTEKTLINMGFPDRMVEAVKFLTRKKGEDYEEYIRIVAYSKLSTKVKIADLEHNLATTRLPYDLCTFDLHRIRRYHKARKFLIEEQEK